ncbi:hypothetical protein MRX96_045426 [Rhipicephalus microplus]
MSTWKAAVGTDLKVQSQEPDDDWETDPDFVNDVTEEEQRWGSKTVEGSGHVADAVNIAELREQVAKDDAAYKKRVLEELPKASYGYGGKFGVQNDRMDKSAVGNDYIASLHKHASQTDAVKGFGGKFGVQKDRQDKCAVGWEHHESVEKHASQKDYSTGFGGKFGTDYAIGFGGKFGVQSDRQDTSAVGWNHIEKVEKHESQKDYSKGFGGKFGIEKDKQDKSKPKPAYQKPRPDIEVTSERAKSLRSRFENMAKAGEEEARKLAEEERKRRLQKDQAEKEAAKKAEEERQKRLRDEHKRIDQLQEQLKAAEDRDEEVSERKPRSDSAGSQPDESELIRPGTRKNHSRVSVIPRELVVPTKQVASPDVSPTQETEPLPQKLKKCRHPAQRGLQRKSRSQKLLRRPPKKIVPQIHHSPVESESSPDSGPGESLEEGIYEHLEPVSTEKKMSAVALYDYQAADYDEISFDPDDIITDIETIDEGWWRGKCNGKVGLFPANYVQPLY